MIELSPAPALRSIAPPIAPEAPHRYRGYGLTILSDIALPELLPAGPGPIDLEIRRVPTAPDFPPPDAPTAYDWSADRQDMLWPAVGRFTIVGLARIEVEPAPGVEDRLLAFPLLGPVMALLKHLHGCLVLHGSAIRVNGQGAVFMGDKLAGKSTLASAFVARGHELLSDDVVAISGLLERQALIDPAFPLVKLCPKASRLLAETESEAWPEVLPGFPKRQHRLPRETMPANIAPRLLLVLDRGQEARIHPLDGGAVFGALMHNCYVKKFIGQTLGPTAGARHLAQIAALTGQATVARLEVPGSITRLGEVVDLVEQQLAAGDLSGA